MWHEEASETKPYPEWIDCQRLQKAENQHQKDYQSDRQRDTKTAAGHQKPRK